MSDEQCEHILGLLEPKERFCTSLTQHWPRYTLTELIYATDVNSRPLTVCTFWSCPQLFWLAIFDPLGMVLGKTVDPDPLTALLGIPSMPNIPKATQHVIAFTILLARRLILLKWTTAPPTHNRWDS